MKNLTNEFVGVDVSKKRLDIYIYPTNKSFSVKNCKQGIASFLRRLGEKNVQSIVCESSGGYEHKMLQQASAEGYSVFRVDPKRVKSFIFSQGIRAKTDKIDAKMIALFAEKTTTKFKHVNLSSEEEELKELTKRKFDLTQMIAKEKVRVKAPMAHYCKEEISEHILFMKKQREALNDKISTAIGKNKNWKKKAEIVESMPGIGNGTSAVLISEVPELGKLNGKQISSLIGVAPFTKQSGSYEGKAYIGGGRAAPRHAIYMAVLTASCHNPVLKSFYNGLIKRGKPPKVALVAVMRKIIVILNAMMRDQQTWRSQAV